MTTIEADENGVQDSTVTKLEPYVPGPNAIDVTLEKDGGVLKEIKQQGISDELPPLGSSVSVHYVGTLTDGSKFDSSRDRGEKFEFTLGKGNVIKAWDLGVATMKKGEVAVLYCKSNYAYGESGSPPRIPPNATLVFEVELFDWKLEDLSKKKDRGILRRTLKPGSGYSSPNEEALVEVSLIGRHEGRIFDQRDLSFTLGEGSELNIPDGLEHALHKFKKHERSVIQLKSSYAFGSAGNEAFGIPPNADVEYEIEMKNFEKAKEAWSMDADEKLEQAKICKEKGTSSFRVGKYSLAVKQYKKIIGYLEHEKSLKDEKAKERDALLLASHLNQAMCYLKLEDFKNAREMSDKALELDPKNDKGLFRKGQALLSMREPEEAKKNFEAILAIDPNNKAAANQVVICTTRIREERQKEKALYSNIFNKMAEADRQVGHGWRFGWWDESKREVQLEVDLEEVEKEKELVLKQARAARKKDWEDLIKRKNLPKPNIKLPFKREDVDDDEEENKVNDAKPIDSQEKSSDDNTSNDLEVDRSLDQVQASEAQESGGELSAQPSVAEGIASTEHRDARTDPVGQ